MQVRRFPLLVIMLWSSMLVTAQKTTNKPTYFGSLQTGLLAGSSDAGFTTQTLQGVQVKNWIAALGFGFEDYGIPSLPLVLHGQRNFTRLKHQPFVYAQSGIQFALKNSDWNQKLWDGSNMYDMKTGFIAEAGAGYQWTLHNRLKLVLSTGFSYKHNQVIERQFMYWIDILPGNDPPYNYNTLDYYYRRFTCKFGIEF